MISEQDFFADKTFNLTRTITVRLLSVMFCIMFSETVRGQKNTYRGDHSGSQLPLRITFQPLLPWCSNWPRFTGFIITRPISRALINLNYLYILTCYHNHPPPISKYWNSPLMLLNEVLPVNGPLVVTETKDLLQLF